MRTIGTQAKGVRLPIIVEGDDLKTIVANSVLNASKQENFSFNDNDIVGVTEAVVARAQGNYATTDDIAQDVKNHFHGEPIGVVFPILSRNRFSVILKGIAKATSKVYVQLSYPADEVGNHLVSFDQIDDNNVDPYKDSFTEKTFRDVFGKDTIHEFTGIDYIDFYKSLSPNIEVVFSNDPKYILNFTKNVVASDIHTRKRTKRILKSVGANVIALDDILTSSVNGSGFNSDYGLLGSNKAGDEKVKLFPKDCKEFVTGLKEILDKETGKNINVMIYGDGAFKDPVGKIWEFADPVVCPAHTGGMLSGTPNEFKIKYLADTKFKHLKGEELDKALTEYIKTKEGSLVASMESEGTTPRQITDLVGSLCDLVSGSGDKGTPVILIQGYFDNYSSL